MFNTPQVPPPKRMRLLQILGRGGWLLAGINWLELRLAYSAFLGDASAGIKHILLAQKNSRWQQWVERRLARQSSHLAGRLLAVDLVELSKLAPDTLGGAYGRHMLSTGLDPEIFIANDLAENWLDQRTAIYHDIHHVLLGFDASPIGEFGVAAFALVQYRDLLNVFVLSFVPLSLVNPAWTLPLLRSLMRGLRLGLQGKPVVGYAVEENWEKPLVLVRQELGLLD